MNGFQEQLTNSIQNNGKKLIIKNFYFSYKDTPDIFNRKGYSDHKISDYNTLLNYLDIYEKVEEIDFEEDFIHYLPGNIFKFINLQKIRISLCNGCEVDLSKLPFNIKDLVIERLYLCTEDNQIQKMKNLEKIIIADINDNDFEYTNIENYKLYLPYILSLKEVKILKTYFCLHEFNRKSIMEGMERFMKKYKYDLIETDGSFQFIINDPDFFAIKDIQTGLPKDINNLVLDILINDLRNERKFI